MKVEITKCENGFIYEINIPSTNFTGLTSTKKWYIANSFKSLIDGLAKLLKENPEDSNEK